MDDSIAIRQELSSTKLLDSTFFLIFQKERTHHLEMSCMRFDPMPEHGSCDLYSYGLDRLPE